MTEEAKDVNGIDSARLQSYIDRIERLEEEKKALQVDIKEIFEEAKSANFDVKALKQILKLRKQNAAERQEIEFVVDCYKKAIGMI